MTPMSTTIYLARHGDHAEVGRVLSGRSDIALSQAGRFQAGRLAATCAGRSVGRIESSPQPRTRETAGIVAERLRLDVAVSEALDEIDFGAWTGSAFADLDPDPAWRKWNAQRATAAAPGGESMAAAQSRIVDHLDDLAASGAGSILCVSHCDMIRAAIAHYLGLGLDGMFALEVAPGSLSTLAFGSDGVRLVGLNEVPA
jgi:broad specificity phosphatase PhoE